MDTTRIEHLIAETAADPDAAVELHDLLAVLAERNGIVPDERDLDRGARFVIAYMEQVPYMLKVAITAAINVGLEREMQQILSMVVGYWDQEEDIIPDHLGVIGLLDDAYCSLTTLQAFSSHYQLQTGKHLFPDDLSAANRVMRQVIGDPYVGQLDDFVTRAIRESGVMDAVRSLASEDKERYLAANANIWNHGPAGEMSVEPLLALGAE
jgi:uncharacterized membrane protein YkvA (DUF1232 family)